MPLPDIGPYRTALQHAVASYASAITPVDAPLPDRAHVFNLRSDATSTGLTLAGLMRHLTGHWACSLNIHAGKKVPIQIPSVGIMQCDVATGTQAHITFDLRDGAPISTIVFQPPVYVHNPVPGVVGKLVNPWIGYQLETIDMGADNSIWVDGRVDTAMHRLCCRMRRRVKAPPSEARPESHSMVGLWLATGATFLRAIPVQAFKVAERALNMSLEEQQQGDFFSLLESIKPLIGKGHLQGDANVHADRPIVIHNDIADVLLGAGEFAHSIRATVRPHQGGISLRLKPSTQIVSDSARMGISGQLLLDGRCVQGRQVALSLDRLKFDALFNNGTPAAMLLPLRVDTSHQQPAQAVASAAFDFTYPSAPGGSGADAHGALNFCLAANVADHDRHLQSHGIAVHLRKSAMQLTVKGKFERQPAPNPATHVDLTLAVGKLDVLGQVHAPQPSSGINIDAPLHVEAHSRERRAIRIDLGYHDPAPGNVFGATLAFDLPVSLPAPAVLAVKSSQGSLGLRSADLWLRGDLRAGSHVRRHGLDVDGHVHVELKDIAGQLTLHQQEMVTVQLRETATLTLLGRTTPGVAYGSSRGYVLAPPEARVYATIVRATGSANLQVQGEGAFSVPACLPQQSTIHLGLPGGGLRLGNTQARLASDDLRFAWNHAGYSVTSNVGITFSSLLDGHYGAALSVTPHTTSFVPLTDVLPSDADSDESIYDSAQEDFDGSESDSNPEDTGADELT